MLILNKYGSLPNAMGFFGLVVFSLFSVAITYGQRQNLMLDGDFETGDFSQFGGKEAAEHELRLVTAPVRAGQKACRVEVNSHELNVGGGRYRGEFVKNGAGSANHERER